MPALTLTRRVSVDDPTIVLALFPSLGTTTHVWDGVLTAISSRISLDALLFDLPGHGGAPAAIEVDSPASARDASHQITDLVGERPVIVAGASMGGAIAIEIASLRSANVAAFASSRRSPARDTRNSPGRILPYWRTRAVPRPFWKS